MKPFRFLYYVGKGDRINWLIRTWTGIFEWNSIPASHEEVWTADEEGRFIDVPGNPYLGLCWTSTTRDNWRGTCVRPASEVLKTPENWVYTEHQVPETWEQDGLAYMQYEVDNNKGYAYIDIGKFIPVLRHFVNDPQRNICSEFCHNAKVAFGIYPGPFRVVHPREDWKKEVKLHRVATHWLKTGEVIHDGYKWVGRGKAGATKL